MEICIFKKIFTAHLSTNKKMNTNKFFRKIHLIVKRNIWTITVKVFTSSVQQLLQWMIVWAVHCFAVDNELRHRVWVHVHGMPHAARDLLILHKREEHVDKLLAVRRSNCFKNFSHEIPRKLVHFYLFYFFCSLCHKNHFWKLKFFSSIGVWGPKSAQKLV